MRTDLFHFLREAFFFACEKHVLLNSYSRVHGCHKIIKQERMKSRRVVLSDGICVE